MAELTRALGWLPAVPDFRDYTPDSPPAMKLLAQLAQRRIAPLATRVDLREYFLDAPDQATLASSSAHACIGLIEYFQRRAIGEMLRPSSLFLYQNSVRISGRSGDCGTDLRNCLKAMIRCGIPPERYWPYDPDRLGKTPDAFLYTFRQPYAGLSYLRLDGPNRTGNQSLTMIKAFLSAGLPCTLGFPVPDSLSSDGIVPYRPTFDTPQGGQSLVVVGFDDRRPGATRGALLIRNSWGPEWGEEGYGWLPYVYVERQMAIEFWTLLHPAWIESGEFAAPQINL